MKNKAASPGTQTAAKRASASGPKKTAPKNGKSVNGVSPERVTIDRKDFERLQDYLREAQETLDAIRNGDVDAVVVSGAHGSQVYSLSGAEQPYRIYVEQMQEGAVTVTEDGLVLYSNQRFADMAGLPLERMISSQILDHVPPPAWEELKQVFQDEQTAVKHECVLGLHGGGHLPVHLTASRLPLEDQQVMCLVVTDLTEQKEREELRLGKEGAEKASLAKDAFLAALSHELRTPLTPALLATVELEQDASLTKDVRSTLSMIRRNVELEARLIDDLLDLTRITCGKLEMNRQAVDFHTILNQALDICKDDIVNRQQRLDLALNAQHGSIQADPVRLQQALWNIIRNAVKFTPPQGVITIETDNPDDGTVRVRVTDTGIGFTPEVKVGMFKAFEQGSREITRRFGGLGLGLAISHSIVEAHDGRLLGDSEGRDKGAEFTLELPVKKAEAGVPSHSSPAQAAAEAGKGLRILLVEDHADTRNNMTLLLRRSGHQITSAESATEALDKAGEGDFDLVISDLGLPDMSGLDLMRQLRDGHGLRGIAVSGYGMEEDIRRSHEAGFIHHLTKPIHMEQLRKVIQHCSPG